MSAEGKRALRAHMQASLASLPEARTETWSRAIARHLYGSAAFDAARGVMLYASLPGEVNTWPIMDRVLSCGKTLFLPVTLGQGRMIAARATSVEGLRPGRFYGILEPDGDQALPGEIDLVLCPGLAFDRAGGRLGRGGGYYDRFLAGLACKIVALAFEAQMVENVPVEPHDFLVDAVITERGIVWRNA